MKGSCQKFMLPRVFKLSNMRGRNSIACRVLSVLGFPNVSMGSFGSSVQSLLHSLTRTHVH